jgi:MFS transporter, MHS family, proline/betaine transporter
MILILFTERMFFTAILVFVASTAFGPIPGIPSDRFPTAIRNSASGFVYNGGMIIGSFFYADYVIVIFLVVY